ARTPQFFLLRIASWQDPRVRASWHTASRVELIAELERQKRDNERLRRERDKYRQVGAPRDRPRSPPDFLYLGLPSGSRRCSAPLTAGQPAACRQTTTMPCRGMTPHSSSAVDTHLLIVVRGLSDRGDPYLPVFLPDGVLLPGRTIATRLDSDGSPTPRR